MAEAREDVHALRPGGGVEQGPALRERHDVVAVAVEDQEGGAQPADAAQGRVGVGDEGRRKERVVHAAELTDAPVNVESKTGPAGGRSSARSSATAPPSDSPR